MDEQKIANGCKMIGKYLIIASFLFLFGSYAGLFRPLLNEERWFTGLLWMLGGIGVGCVFRWLGSFIEPKEPKDP